MSLLQRTWHWGHHRQPEPVVWESPYALGRAEQPWLAAGGGHNTAKPQMQFTGVVNQLFPPLLAHFGAELGLWGAWKWGRGGWEHLSVPAFPFIPSMLQCPVQTACPLLPADSSLDSNHSTRLPPETKTSNTSNHTTVESDVFNGKQGNHQGTFQL